MLVGIVSLPETSCDVKLAAVRVFGKMRCSSSIANRAYKVGKDLMLCLQEEELKAEMLSSLSKLAFGSSLLSPQQVEFLLSSTSNMSSSIVRVRSLKCLYFLLGGGVCSFSIERNVLATSLNIIEEKDLSPNLRCEVLRILHKTFCSILPTQSCLNMRDFFSLVQVLKTSAQSSFKAEQWLALYLLLDILCSFKSTIRGYWTYFSEKWVAEFLECQSFVDHRDGPTLLACDAILLIINAMSSHVEQMIVMSGVSLPEAKQEFTNLLNLILHLVIEYPSLAPIVLDRLRCLIQTLVIACGTSNMVVGVTYQECSQAEIVGEKHESVLSPCGDNKKKTTIVSELILCICRFVNACLNILDETCACNSEVHHIVKSLVEFIKQNGSCSCEAYAIFSLDIHADIISNSCKKTLEDVQDSKDSNVFTLSGISHNVFWAQQELRTLEFTKKMLRERNYWEAYRAGMYACSQGAWFAAAFTFRRLMDGLLSDFCGFWVRSLMLLAGAESEIKLILFPKIGMEMINKMHTENDCGKTFSSVKRVLEECSGGDGDLRGCKGKFAKIYSRICSSEEILAASGTTDGVYYFQRWFLSLRSKVLEIVIDMLGLLDSYEPNEEQLTRFAKLSHSLNNVSREYDLLAVSFLDIDCRSFRNISRQALSCSILTFCAFFALYLPKSPVYVSSLSSGVRNMAEVLQTGILKDLLERIWKLDEKFALELQKLMPEYGEVANTLHSRTETKSFMLIDRASLLIYKSFIIGVLRIQEDSKKVKDEEGVHRLLLQGIQLLSGIIKRWIETPCLVPKYFFRVRPCVGAELFIFNTDPKNPNRLSIIPGFQLSLNLCIQLKNASRVPHGGVSRIYCILAVRSSYHVATSGGKTDQARWRFQARETDETVELFDMLLYHIKTDGIKASRKHLDGGGWVTTCVCFEPNQKGQGFSTCLLDVSALPEGSYPIKWQSCCIDRKGHHWSLLSLNSVSLFTIKKL